LLQLLRAPYRVAYKQAKSLKYWPNKSVQERVGRLLDQYRAIDAKLKQEFGPYGLSIPDALDGLRLSDLKRYEDALDALISCWVGVCYTRGRARPLGDDTAAIWCPTEEQLGKL
jgi:predicted RNase H-like nuclease